MTLLDIGILLLLVVVALNGFHRGAAHQVLTLIGGGLGLFLGAALAPPIAALANSPFSRAFMSLLIFFGGGVIGALLGRTLGERAWSALRRLRLGTADSILGSATSAVAMLLVVWLSALALSALPTPALSNAIHESSIVRGLVRTLPAQPTVFARIRGLIASGRFPQVFEGLEPPIPPPVALPADPEVRAAFEAAQNSTVRVFGPGCGGIQTGSGFFGAQGFVVTNAHVVAGLDKITIEDNRLGRRNAIAVVFDPRLDIAVLKTTGASGPALPLQPDNASRGATGAFLGHPGGGPLEAKAAAILRQLNAIGRDIYGNESTERNVYQIQGEVREGNSGGPLVKSDGTVMGVIFAASTTDGNVGYAITSTETIPKLNEARSAGELDTGPCT